MHSPPTSSADKALASPTRLRTSFRSALVCATISQPGPAAVGSGRTCTRQSSPSLPSSCQSLKPGGSFQALTGASGERCSKAPSGATSCQAKWVLRSSLSAIWAGMAWLWRSNWPSTWEDACSVSSSSSSTSSCTTSQTLTPASTAQNAEISSSWRASRPAMDGRRGPGVPLTAPPGRAGSPGRGRSR